MLRCAGTEPAQGLVSLPVTRIEHSTASRCVNSACLPGSLAGDALYSAQSSPRNHHKGPPTVSNIRRPPSGSALFVLPTKICAPCRNVLVRDTRTPPRKLMWTTSHGQPLFSCRPLTHHLAKATTMRQRVKHIGDDACSSGNGASADQRIFLFDLGEAISPSRPQLDCTAVLSGGQRMAAAWRHPKGLKSSTYFTAFSILHFLHPSFFVRLGIPFLRPDPHVGGRRRAPPIIRMERSTQPTGSATRRHRSERPADFNRNGWPTSGRNRRPTSSECASWPPCDRASRGFGDAGRSWANGRGTGSDRTRFPLVTRLLLRDRLGKG